MMGTTVLPPFCHDALCRCMSMLHPHVQQGVGNLPALVHAAASDLLRLNPNSTPARWPLCSVREDFVRLLWSQKDRNPCNALGSDPSDTAPR